jgi:hypothetical protein
MKRKYCIKDSYEVSEVEKKKAHIYEEKLINTLSTRN